MDILAQLESDCQLRAIAWALDRILFTGKTTSEDGQVFPPAEDEDE